MRFTPGCLLFAALLAACGASKPPSHNPTPRPEEIGKVGPDKSMARMLTSGNLALARKTAESLIVSRDPGEREVGMYWKAICLLYANQADSAMTIFENRSGKWSGGLRTVHSEAFLRLVRDLSQAQAAARARKEEVAAHEGKLEGLQKEAVDLRAEIARLTTEKEKYEKLLKDLETIR